MIRSIVFMLFILGAVQSAADTTVRTVDFLEPLGLAVNAAGPILVQMDVGRNRLIAANTLSSSLSMVDCNTGAVTNIPLGGRALQHLKAESMTLSEKTGDVYLLGDRCVFVVSIDDRSARTVRTDVQFESVAVDENTGHAFVAGRESKELGFIKSGSKKLNTKNWLEVREELVNLNATPPPPIRKVIADPALGRIVAVDGMDPALYLFDGKNADLVDSRPLSLEAGGRWHLAGYNDETHNLYIVVERTNRNVVQAARIDVLNGNDVVVALPEYREGVGITYNSVREEVYIGYDNHASVHVASFGDGGSLAEIKIPAYGNDAAAIDGAGDRLYVSSWAHGEVDVVDLDARRLEKRITGLGIIPHMFAFAFNPNDGLLYFPKGASAVNGTFGAAITTLDPRTEETKKIQLGWAPIDLIDVPARGSMLVFNSEDQFAEVQPDGTFRLHSLPYDYPIEAIHNADGDVYLSYGPHQSYWPTVYIWGAKDGVLTIETEDLAFYDRRIPRQAQRMALDSEGVLYFTQNNWGKEEQFLGKLTDPVRLYEAGQRLRLVDEVQRENTQRILEYDSDANRLYLVRIGESDDDPSVLQVVDPAAQEVVERIEVGRTAADLLFDDKNLYVANFDSKSVSVIDKATFAVRQIETDEHPLRLCRCGGKTYVLNHTANTLQEIGEKVRTHKLPKKGLPDNAVAWRGKMVVTSFAPDKMYVFQFDPADKKFEKLHESSYPYGQTSFDTRNVSFYTRGQYGDVVFELTRACPDREGRLWVTDFLAGRALVIE